MKIFLILFTTLFIFSAKNVNAQANCAGADPFCTGTTYNFPLATNTTAQSGPNYGCLGSEPNPVWYYLKILTPGIIHIDIHSPSGQDVDFACWGPFNSPTGACTAGLTASCTACPSDWSTDPNAHNSAVYPAGNLVDCSYNMDPNENCHISNALVGQYYMLCITNFSNQNTNVVFQQTNIGGAGSGSTDCTVLTPCSISAVTAVPGACAPLTNLFTLTGTVTFANPPATGILIITDQTTGISQSLNAPFVSPLNYSLPGLTSDGVSHVVNVVFSADNACVFNKTYTAPVSCNACTVFAGPPQTVCGLTTTMAATIQPGDYNYAWSYTGGVAGVTATSYTNPTTGITVPFPGTYVFTWTVTNQNGVTCSANVSIKFSNLPTSPFSFTTIKCFDNNKDTLTYTGNAGPTALYYWNFAGGTAIPGGNSVGPQYVTWTTAGNHTVTLDSVVESGCSSTATSHTINTPTDLITSVSTNPVTCTSGNNGTVIINVSGGVSGYVYNYSNCSCPTAPTVAGNYIVTITDQNGCFNVENFGISQPSPITVTQVHHNLDCYNDASGWATVTVTGGTPIPLIGYNYSWYSNPGLNNPTHTNMPAGVDTCYITDNNGCSVKIAITLTQPSQLTATILPAVTNVTCAGLCNGVATVAPIGGTTPYVIAWAGTPVSTTTDNKLCAGNTLVTVTDANLCTTTATAVITQPPVLTANITSHTDLLCYNVNTGSATVTANGGTGSYLYHWQNGSVTTTINNLASGPVNVTVVDANGCDTTATITLTQPPILQANISNAADPKCHTSCDGKATVTGVGGTPPYVIYWWTGPQGNQNTVTTLCEGNHFVTVTDLNNCTASTSVYTSAPTVVTAAISNVTHVSCYGGNNGTATVNANGGTPGYTYIWNTIPAQTTAIATNMIAGTFTVTVRDTNNCDTTAIITITQPALLDASAIITSNYHGSPISCNGFADGKIDLTVVGGTVPYTYNWSNNLHTEDLNNILAGTYTLTVIDTKNCKDSVSLTLTEPLPLVSSIASISDFNGYGIRCFADSNGTVDLLVTGGTTPYTYNWNNNFASTQDLLNVKAGAYSVIVTDANNCMTISDTLLTQPTILTSSVLGFNVSCFGLQDGHANLTVNGGAPGYNFFWSDTSFSKNLMNVGAGTYYVTVVDTNSCVIIDTITITQMPKLLITASDDQLICRGVPTNIFAEASGGTGSGTYSYSWSSGEITSTIVVGPSLNTTYNVFVTDANGCMSDTESVIINVRPPLVLSLYSDNYFVCKGFAAYIYGNTSGGDGGPYTLFDHTNTEVNPQPRQVFPAQTTDYIFTARDNCGSVTQDTITINVLPSPTVAFSSDKTKGCRPLTINFNESLNDAGASYTWNFHDNSAESMSHYPSHTFDVEGSFDVSLTVKSKDGCLNTGTKYGWITVYPLPEARFNYIPEYISILDPVVYFKNLSSNSVVNYWSFGDKDTSIDVDPIHVYKTPGMYPIFLVAESDRGCRDTLFDKLLVRDEYSFYAPSAFAPESVIEANRIFNVSGKGISPLHFNLSVYNRWGELLYETTESTKGWDGMVSGDLVKGGSYIWICSYHDLGKVLHTKSGYVTVIR